MVLLLFICNSFHEQFPFLEHFKTHILALICMVFALTGLLLCMPVSLFFFFLCSLLLYSKRNNHLLISIFLHNNIDIVIRFLIVILRNLRSIHSFYESHSEHSFTRNMLTAFVGLDLLKSCVTFRWARLSERCCNMFHSLPSRIFSLLLLFSSFMVCDSHRMLLYSNVLNRMLDFKVQPIRQFISKFHSKSNDRNLFYSRMAVNS